MAEEPQRGSSVRNLPPGKMNNIRKMFESGDKGETSKLAEVAEESGKTPKPVPRQKPPGLSSVKPAMSTKPALPKGQKPQLKEKNYAETKTVAVSQSNGHKQSDGEMRNLAALKVPSGPSSTAPLYAVPRKKLSPTVSRRVSALQQGVGSDKENEKVKPPLPSSPPRPVSRPSFNQSHQSEKRPGSRNSDPEVPVVPRVKLKSKEQVEQEKFRRKSEPNSPKRTITETNGEDEDSLSVSQRLKQFEVSQGSEMEDSSSVISTSPRHRAVRRQNSIGTARELTHSPLHAGVSPFNFSRAVPPLPELPPPSSDRTESSAPAPPRKPPRTHAHDEYLKTKIKKSKEVVILENDLYEGSNAKTIVKIASDNAQKGQSKQNGNHVHQVTKPVPKDSTKPTKGVGKTEEETYKSVRDRISKLQHRPISQMDSVRRREPPHRPPPPKQRPFSVATDHMISTSQPNTPIRRACVPARQMSAVDLVEEDFDAPSGSRHGHMVMSMVDELTERPVQRYPLRKSFSSDDLHRAGIMSGDPVYMDPIEVLDFRDDTYEAYVDAAGYAVPNKFVKRGLGEKRSLDPAMMNGRQIGAALKAKIGGFRKIFVSDTSSSSQKQKPVPVHEQDPRKVNRRKMNQIKFKLNQAFSAVQKYVSGHSEPIPEEADDIDKDWDTLSIDSDFVDVAEIQRRVEYVSSVKAKTKKSIKKTHDFLSKIYPQLFEYALVVGLRPLSGAAGYKPYIIHKFPETRAYKVSQEGNLFACPNMVDSNVSVPVFCFPDANEYKPASNSTSESYSFVLTNIDGERVYGYCRRLKPPDSSLQEVLCIISPVDAFNMYNKRGRAIIRGISVAKENSAEELLDEIEKRRMTSIDLAQELIAASFGRPLPGPGKVVNIRTLDVDGELETLFLNRPSDSRRENVNYECLMNYLGTDKLIKVFSSLMMERRILLCSSSLSSLTHTVHALVALLYPFCWQHIYIPILPPDMLDVCASPTPYLIGILKSHLPQVLQEKDMLEEVVIVDLDKKQFVMSLGDEATLLPKKLQKALKTAINMCKIDNEPESSQWLMVSEAFMRMFIEIMGHFGEFITTQQNGRKVFDKERFLGCVNAKGIRQVLEWFTETQMFEVFITNQLERREWGTVDLFMSRLVEFQKEDPRDSRVGLGQKMKNFGKALKTKLGQT